MSLLTGQLPFSNPGHFLGAVRRREILIDNVKADAFRSASQNQEVGQSARSFSGANANNDQVQIENLSQDVNTTFDMGNTAQINGLKQVVESADPFTLDSGAIADENTELNDLSIIKALPITAADNSLNDGDKIVISGTEGDGTVVSGTFVYGAGNNGTTLGVLRDFIDGLFTSATVSLTSSGHLRLIAENDSASQLSLQIAVPTPTVVNSSAVLFQGGSVGDTAKAIQSFPWESGIFTGDLTEDNILNLITNFGGNISPIGSDIKITGTNAAGNPVSGLVGVNVFSTLRDLADGIEDLFNAGAPDVNVTVVPDVGGDPGDVLFLMETVDFVEVPGGDFGFFIRGDDIFITFNIPGTGPVGFTGHQSLSSGSLEKFETIRLPLKSSAGVLATTDDLNSTELVDQSSSERLQDGDELRITTTSKDGSVTDDVLFVYGPTASGYNGTTIQDLMDILNGVNSGPNGSVDHFPDSTITFDGFNIVITEDVASNGTSLALSISDVGPHFDPISFATVSVPAEKFEQVITSINGPNSLARGTAIVAQNQGGDQSAFSNLNGVAGTQSNSANTLTQRANTNQVFDVVNDQRLINRTAAYLTYSPFNGGRFRTISANEENSDATAIFSSGQQQGRASNPFSQTAVANGANSQNAVTQIGTLNQTGTVSLSILQDLERNEHTVDLSPRTTELLASMNGLRAINSNTASQEQSHLQFGGGGSNEQGSQTENGGSTNNTANSSLVATDTVTVLNSVSMLI